MKQRMWRLLPLFLCTLYILLSLASAENSPSRPSDDSPPLREEIVSQRDRGYRAQEAFYSSRQNGDDEVYEATNILRKIRKSHPRPSRFTKPSGVLGTTAYYAKELFFLLFMNKPPQPDLLSTQEHQPKLSQPLSKAVKLLEDAARERNADAMYMLAEMNFYGNYTHPRNYKEAFRRYHELADLNGNSSAQYMLGLMYSTGMAGAVETNQAKAMLYHTFAAKGGDARSQMTLGYRHNSGIATPKSCDEAVKYYKKVADKAIAFSRSGPPGGHSMVKEAYRLSDDGGGIYGEGASVSSAGPNAKQGGPNSDAHAAPEDVLEYLDLMSRKGDLKATFSLGRVHYEGSRTLKRDFFAAKGYFMDVARKYWSREGKIKNDAGPGVDRLASKAAGYIGRMFLRGEGMEQSFSKAKIWFNRGVANGDPLCQYSLGLMYLHGLGVPQDPVKAADYFAPAADSDLASAQVQMGALFLDQGDVPTAVKYFEHAARNNHIEAYYYLAELTSQGIGRDRSCNVAVVYYKIVAEKADMLLSSFQDANDAYQAGDLETALVEYLMAAEQGFESGQANVAYMLDQTPPKWSFRSLSMFNRKKSPFSDAALALTYWTRSAKQNNIDSMVKMGDYYLEGLGTTPDSEKAAACYQAAAETMQSAQAMWNMGWMHENGIGLEQDFHLAKRMYDQALETNPVEAYLPVTLALFKLRIRSAWNTATHGKVNSIRDEPAPRKPFSLSEFVQHFLEADAAAYYEALNAAGAGGDPNDPLDGNEWETTAGPDGLPGDEIYDEIDEGILESLVILGLVGLLAWLVWYRQQRLERRRREAEERARGGGVIADPNGGGVVGEERAPAVPGQQPDGGFFPPPEDPNFNQWIAGGVGH
ncbi:MAG: ERAD-associated protein [Bathelium mastoideum]|nr:MAG: ERAD-associated protein [Bathelium mastoideum]